MFWYTISLAYKNTSFPIFKSDDGTVLVCVYLCPEIMHVTDVIAILKNVPKGPVRSESDPAI